jgi:phospholipid/cholesterol/gamma-HCH transport system substrate-binding protein
MRSRTVREGTVGLFAILGLVIFAGITIWLRGAKWGEKSYQIIVDFSDVSGLQLGAPVTYRGVQVGKLIGLQPQSNNVMAILEITSNELRIPRQGVKIQTNRYGLIGEASIDITPGIPLSPEAEKINPLDQEQCHPNDQKALIICDQARLTGDTGAQIFSSITQLAETYGDPAFLDRFATTIITEAKLDRLSSDISNLSKTTQKEIKVISRDFSQTSAAITRTANDTSLLVRNINNLLLDNRQNLDNTFQEANQLILNANALVTENRQRIEETLIHVNDLSQKLTLLAVNLNESTEQINNTLNNADTEKIVQDIQILTANAAEISENLKEVSETLNDPATLLTLQQTLDSARSTFENAEKITSDLDELLGDPEFREKLRRLVEGLSNLLSSSQQLDQQIQNAQQLETATQALSQKLENHGQLRSVKPVATPKLYPIIQESNQNLTGTKVKN